jgi:predicted transcriptional regulator
MKARNPLVNLFSKTFDRPSDLLCCAFGLKTYEIDVYITLLAGPSSVKDIAQKIDADRSTVQRALQKLQELKLVTEPERKNIDRGGYYYEYQAISASDVRNQILDQLEHWYKRTRKFLLESWASEIE